MGLDYSAGCVNFRDVGEFLALLSSDVWLPPGRLLRGGKLEAVTSADAVSSPGTILNLRNGPDVLPWDIPIMHFPTANTLEKYDTQNREVRRWLNAVVGAFGSEALVYPVLVHCTSGKDRTGVVVAALLSILGVPEELIVQEYLLSDGEVRAEWIKKALAGIGQPQHYFNRVDVKKVRSSLLG